MSSTASLHPSNPTISGPLRTHRAGRLLFLSCCGDTWGGSEELWAGAARVLARAGHEVMACKTGVDPNHARIVELRADGVEVQDFYGYRMPAWRRIANRALGSRARFLPWDAGKVVFTEQMRPRGFEMAVVCQSENFDGLPFVDVCRDLGIPYVLICQKASDLNWPFDSNRDALRRAFLESRRTYFVSEHNSLLTQRQLGLELTNSEVVRNPFLTDASGALPWPQPDKGRLRLACVARLYVLDKGQDVLLKVAARRPWRERNLEINLYGQGVHRGALEGLARSLDAPNIRFCGFTQSVDDVWRSHHALVLPSRSEGLPLALVEAMMCGRIGITSNAGGNAELVDDGETGFTARGTDETDFEEALERAWQRRDDWEQMGREAALRIRQQVPPDPCGVFASKLEAVFQAAGRDRCP